MENTYLLLPQNNPEFASLPTKERISVATSFIESFEALVKKRHETVERIERSELNDEFERYWNAWRSNFRGRESFEYFGREQYVKLSLRFYSASGKRGFKEARGYCQDLFGMTGCPAYAYYYFADLEYRYGLAADTAETFRIREQFDYYAKALSLSAGDIEKNAALAAARGYIRNLRNNFPDEWESLEKLAEELLRTHWGDILSVTTAESAGMVLEKSTEPSHEVTEKSLETPKSREGTTSVGESKLSIGHSSAKPIQTGIDEAFKRSIEEGWKDLSIVIITGEKGVKLVRDLKREGFFESFGLFNDRGIEVFDGFKEKHRSIYEFMKYDLILVGENDHVFRDMESSGKGNAVVTFLKENTTTSIVLELRRDSKPPKTDKSVIADKLREAQEIFVEDKLKRFAYH